MAADSWSLWNFCIFSLLANAIIIEAIEYTQNQFDLDNGQIPQFVMFHAPWCGHCKRLRPLWNLVEEHFETSSDLSIKIANVDCTQDTPFCVREKIKAYPTIRLYLKNYVGDTYRGKRKLDALIEFAKEGIVQKPGDSAQTKGVVELREATFYRHTSNGLHFIDFFAPWCKHCQSLAPTWSRLAEEMTSDSGITIGQVDCVPNEKLCKEQGISAYPSLYVYHSSMKVDEYTGDRSFGQLKAYVTRLIVKYKPLTVPSANMPAANEEMMPAVSNLQDTIVLHNDNFYDILGQHKNTFVVFYVDGCDGCDVLFPIWNDLARAVVEEDRTFRIASVDCIYENFLCERYKIDVYPKLIHFRPNGVGEIYFGGLTYEQLYSYIRHREKDEL